MHSMTLSLSGAPFEQRRRSRSPYALRLAALFAAATFFLLGFAPICPAQQSNGSPTAQRGKHVQLEGEMEILYQDFKDRSRLIYTLKVSDGTRVPIHFAKEPPRHLLTGDRVRVDGELSDGVLLSGSTSPNTDTTTSTTTASIPVPNTFGAQSTLVILVNFQDDAVQPYSITDVQNAFFSTASNFLMENSYGQTSLTGATAGWYTIPVSVTACDTSQIATAAQNAATAAGVNLSNYTRYVYFFPYDTVCAFAGASSVGGNPSQTWINGTLDTYVIDHELGHALGLWHSHFLDCGTAATICSNGSIVEYGDLLDTMGMQQAVSPHYNAYQKERLGWLNYGASPSIQTVKSSGTYTIYPYELGGSGPNTLKVLKYTDPTTGAKTWYYLEARQAIGFDAFLTNGTCSSCYTQNETTGVLFHVGTDGNSNSSDLIDMTPATITYYNWWDPSLAVSQSFQDSTAGVTFTTQSVTSAGAVVNIQISGSGSPTSSSGPPALSITTNQASYTPGQTVSLSASATSGGTAVANVAVNFAVTGPSGSKITGSATTGRNGVAVFKFKLQQTAPKGTYGGSATATIKATALSASTQFAVQ